MYHSSCVSRLYKLRVNEAKTDLYEILNNGSCGIDLCVISGSLMLT